MQQIKKILEMVKNEKLSHDDAGKLLAALSARLDFSATTWAHVFGLQAAADFSTDEVAAFLERRAAPTAEAPPKNVGCNVVKFNVRLAGGAEVRANLPVALATHAQRLLAPDMRRAMQEQGVELDALWAMLEADLPRGDLIQVDGPGGTSVHIWVE